MYEVTDQVQCRSSIRISAVAGRNHLRRFRCGGRHGGYSLRGRRDAVGTVEEGLRGRDEVGVTSTGAAGAEPEIG